MKYRDMTPEQKEAKKAWNKKHYDEHHEGRKNRQKKYYAKHHAEQSARMKIYKAKDINSVGVTKNYIRTLSNRIFFKTHAKLQGYEIHHCFTYNDPNKFIYIPKTLHQKIHRLLRYNRIPADSNHWNVIRDLVNSCEEYTYIRT